MVKIQSARRWKGKPVKNSVYNAKLRGRALGLAKKLNVPPPALTIEENDDSENVIENTKDAEEQNDKSLSDGLRIVDLSILGQQLWCVSCKECLSLETIEREIRRGLGSILSIRCHKCLLLNEVTTSKQQCPSGKRNASRFDINYKATMGTNHMYSLFFA